MGVAMKRIIAAIAIATPLLITQPAHAEVLSPGCISHDEFLTTQLGETLHHYWMRTAPNDYPTWHGPHSRDFVACNGHALAVYWWQDGDPNRQIWAYAWWNCPPDDVCQEPGEHYGHPNPPD